ncbi:MAG TPA: glycosyltransferase family 39 protein [Solirubrobacteraceae bacterium]|nr:glycosyltransferase family 39 protein [Solirubrobacteraceae bacterium]
MSGAQVSVVGGPRVSAPSVSPRALEWGALALITIGAGVLRLVALGKVAPDPFYDAAVRSMGLSWHNFFFGAFEPGASVSIDKPPVDLWLQVASVKLLGFSSTTLKLPEALAGTLSVPLLFVAVKRMWSTPAAFAAAVALAVLPIEVITSRSDTMDGVMMALIVLALLLIVIAAQSGRTAWLLAGAAVLGLAFNVKLLESLVALPGLVLLAYLAFPGTPLARLWRMAVAGVVYVAMALAWLTATLLAPAHDRPWAIGSTNGSAWNAAFVFNGTDRVGGKSPEPGGVIYESGHRYPTATQTERDHIPIVPPSATRLLATIGPLSGERLGLELLVALVLGLPALLWALRERPPPRMRRAVAISLPVWAATGIVLFSDMARLHPRYIEGLLPAVAALLGIGVAWAATERGRAQAIALVAALAVTVYYAERLLYGVPAVWWIALACALGAVVLVLVVHLRSRRAAAEVERSGGAQQGNEPAATGGAGAGAGGALLTGALIALTLGAVLAIPLAADLKAIHDHVTDAGYVGALPGDEQGPLSHYLREHQDGARYEVAAESATQIGSLVVADARPIVVLTTYDGRVFTSVTKLEHLIAEGKLRYAFLNTYCPHRPSPDNAACSAPAVWIRAHGTDVSRQAGLPRDKVLWLLPGAPRETREGGAPAPVRRRAVRVRAR